MAIEAGTYALGPENGTLAVRTGRGGAIAKAGHNLLMEVGTWGATMEIGADPRQSVLEMTAASGSMRVLEGSGGMQALSDDDKRGIAQTIDQEVLKGTAIAFRSTSVKVAGEDLLNVAGDLELAGGINPVEFELVFIDGRVSGSAAIKQTAWGMKPYTALFGTLKVSDEVQVTIDAKLSAAA